MAAPTYENFNGMHIWRDENGDYHRDGGQPAIVYDIGHKFYYTHGVLTRDDGPAAIYNCGTYAWYRNNKRHCLTGPAVYNAKINTEEYWIDGTQYSKADWENKRRSIV